MAAGSGILYGSINVLVKLLDIHPFLATTVAYLASATVLSGYLFRLRIQRRDWPKVLTMGLIGGFVAPILLFQGLRQAAASDAGLLLTIEMVATGILASIFLHERFRRPEILGLVFLLAAAILVALAAGSSRGSSLAGVAYILGAAIAWGVDNTVSARLVGHYRPTGLIAIKGLIGGLAALVVVLIARPPMASVSNLAAMAGLGLASIAVSSLLFYNGLIRVGASRTSAMNIATTALIGAVGGVLLLNEKLSWLHAVALAAVAIGAWLLAKYGRPTSSVAAGPTG